MILNKTTIVLGLLAIIGAVENDLHAAQDNNKYHSLYQIAEESLNTNIVNLGSHSYLRAGAVQYQGLWTRDFSFATRGLLLIGRSDVVRDQLDLILANPDSSGMLPKYFDSVSIWTRYLYKAMGKTIPLKEPLKPGYKAGIPPSKSVDSNILVLLAALDYLQYSGDWTWWNTQKPRLLEVFKYYEHIKDSKDGLIAQWKYADWQDSTARDGKIFLTNLYYAVVSERLSSFPEFGIDVSMLKKLRSSIVDTFYDPSTGLYKSMPDEPYISLEGNLLAIDLGFHPVGTPEAETLYNNIKRSEFWNRNPGMPGFLTFPDYPAKWSSPFTRYVGLQHYSDRLYWPWVMALAAKTAYQMDDVSSGSRILEQIQDMAIRDNTIYEIYEGDPPFNAFRTPRYEAEAPFSWNASLILDALNVVNE